MTDRLRNIFAAVLLVGLAGCARDIILAVPDGKRFVVNGSGIALKCRWWDMNNVDGTPVTLQRNQSIEIALPKSQFLGIMCAPPVIDDRFEVEGGTRLIFLRPNAAGKVVPKVSHD